MMVLSCAKASTTEEPDAAIPHVRDCAGGAGQPALLLRDRAERSSSHLAGCKSLPGKG